MFVETRQGIRSLLASPLFLATSVLSLAIGLGATTTVFSIADALLFRAPVAVVDPDRVVDIGRTRRGRGFDTSSYPKYLDIAARCRSMRPWRCGLNEARASLDVELYIARIQPS